MGNPIYMQSKKKNEIPIGHFADLKEKNRMQTTDAGMCNKNQKLEKLEISLSGPEMKSKRCRRQTSKPAKKAKRTKEHY